MKIVLMSGAYVNAGDFLIEQRCLRLLEKYLPKAQVDVWKRNISCEGRLEELRAYDLIVFGGGPGYQKNLYPDAVPFVSDLSSLKTPVVIMGWGWKGKDISDQSIYKQRLSESMIRFVKNAENFGGGGLGCRDWYTVRFLKNLGFHKYSMTGCPAWYDLDVLEGLHVDKKQIKSDVSNICISDAAFISHKWMLAPLAVHLRRKYPKAKIQLIFHRGIKDRGKALRNPLFWEKYQLGYKDISGSAEGFSVYDACDLHIGFRVHAHIYSLSRGKISVLINEDARGNGVNEALGIQNICLPLQGKLSGKVLPRKNMQVLLKAVDDYLDYLCDTDYLQYENACMNIRHYYENMREFVQGFEH